MILNRKKNVRKTGGAKTNRYQRKKVGVVESETLYRNLMVMALTEKLGLNVVGEAADWKSALDLCRRANPHIIIITLDVLHMRGINSIRHIRGEFPDIKILVLSATDGPKLISQMISLGVMGFLPKSENIDDLKEAINAVSEGRLYVKSSPIEPTEINRHFYLKYPKLLGKLTKRELHIIRLIASSYTNKAIAGDLNLSIKTIEVNRASLCKKLNIHDIAGLTLFAVETGLVNI